MANDRHLSAVRVRVSQEQIDNLRTELAGVKNGVNKAVVGAINKTLPKGRTIVVDQLWEKLAIKRRGNIFHRTSVIKATSANPAGAIRILGRQIGLINFKTKDTNARRRGGSGVIAQLYRSGESEIFPKAFIGIGASDNKHVFQRLPGKGHIITDKAHHKPNIGRRAQSLESLKGMSLLKAYKDHPEIEAASVEKVGAEFGNQLSSQIDRLLKRRKVTV